ncbi:MAG TPA: histidine phosphatase family protein [Candidatus Dormibacteraeota bacterium]|nr:histidine phosphatase family protein [Candidatus Dormibacteraeota bacterium]
MTITQQLVLVRHGETEWSRERRHTGRTDVPLTSEGEAQAAALKQRLGAYSFAAVLCSPLQRARRTCELAGYGDVAVLDGDLQEWDYGSYDGLTLQEIRKERPGWNLWADGARDGESLQQVATRAERVIARARMAQGDVLLFGHGHILRVLAACWLELPARAGQRFALGPASPSVLSYEHEWTVMRSWNVSG